MEMTRHKNYATFKRYIKITSKVKKEEMNRLWGKKFTIAKEKPIDTSQQKETVFEKSN